MKQTLLFAFLLLAFTAIGQEYTKEWSNVLEKEADGEVKQAALLTDVIYKRAKKENNQQQIIKAFFFRSKYMQVIEEDAQFKIITEIQAAIKSTKFPGNQVLSSIYAEMLSKIYSKNQSRIRVLANLQYPGNDYRQWGGSNFKDEINSIYAQSLNNKEALYKASTADFEAIIDFAPALSGYKRPLYDFLAECYLNYLWNDTDSGYDVYWSEKLPQFFGDTKELMKIVDGDSLELPAKRALDLMQHIEQHYTRAKDTLNLDRAVLRRLSYLDKEIYNNDKDAFYLETVSKIAERAKRTPLTYKAMLIKAQLLTTQADKTKYKNNLIEAVKLYDEIIRNKSLNDIAAEAFNLKNNIISRAADIQMMSFTAPEKPILAKVNFKNLDRIKVSFYKIPFSVNTRQEGFRESYLTSKALYFQKSFTLPDKHDYFTYSTEIILPGMEKGNYAVVISPESENSDDGNILNINKITVSGLTVIKEENSDTGIDYQIIDCLAGKPVENVKVYMPKKPEQRTAKDGKICVRYSDRRDDNYITFIHQSDTLEYKFYDRYYSDESDKLRAGGSVFLDRPLYRPGQTVFFKGIIRKTKKDIQGVVANTYFTVIVEDDNNDEIKKFRLKTNEFGSFTDKFELPKNRTGRFSVIVEEDDNDNPDYDEVFWDEVYFDSFQTDFSVEEYKRPKFEVTFNDVKEAVRLNEQFSVKGSAKSFSGAGISGGEVEYRVKRNSRRYWYDSYGGRDENIKEGKTTTDADGNFTIEFNAEPDDSFDPEDLPVFSYSVYADVTDINGETHSSQTTVNAGYHSITVSAVVAESINVNDKASITLITNNLNGQFKAAKGTVTVYKVAAPERYLAKRPWNEPEIQVIQEDEFVQTFPYLPYKTVNDSVIKKNPVLSQAVDTGIDKEILLSETSKWKSGSYELVFTAKDSVGNEVTTSRRFVLKNDKDKVPADKRIFEYEVRNKDFAKDGYVAIELSAGLALSVNVTATDGNKKIYDKQHDVNADKIIIKIPVNSDKDKLIEFLISYVWQNEYYSHPFSEFITGKNEKLAIEALVINSKLVPGNKETWSFNITGSKKPSEVLASMYDASLDRLMEDSSYYCNRWSDFSAFIYNNGGRLYRNLLTTGTTTVSFSESLKMQQTTRSSDAFYMYGFDFDNTRNSYFGYTPKGKLRKKGDRVISGVVTDSQGLPIPGVSVTIKGSNDGVLTDIDGKYTIHVSKDTELKFTSVGSVPAYYIINASDLLNVKLTDDMMLLQDVVVEAYRSTTRATSNIAVTTVSSKTIQGRPNANFIETLQGQVPGLNISTGSGQPGASSTVILRGAGSINGSVQPLYVIDGVPLDAESFKSLEPADIASLTVLKDAGATSIYGNRGANGVIIINTKSGAKEIEALQQVKARKNFDETAFFYPQITTDKEGKLTFSFTTPEALTEWKLRLLAHNKNAASGYYENTFHTQKDLMVVPNMPRFLRERDTITLVSKVTNLTGEVKTGNALLQLFDAVTMEAADAQMQNIQKIQPFTIPAKGSVSVSWKVTMPKGMQGVQYKIVAKAGDFSDGEENILPVVTNSVTVAESIPLWVKPNTTKEYSFEKFDESLNNTNITQRGLTLEYTSNPAWLALQSLPYLMEFEHECAEQVFSRYYANSIAAHVLNSNPKIAEVFAAWRKSGKPLSKFEQNEELKSILLAESPWILENQSSEEIKNRLATLFDLYKMKASLETSFIKLENKQMPSGGFPWFEGGKESSYITRHIAAGFGHLSKLGVTLDNQKEVDAMTKEAVQFMDREFFEGHKKRLAFVKKGGKYDYELPYDGMHYLYARSFYLEKYPLSDSLKKVTERYVSSMITSTAYLKMKWLGYSLYEKGLAALIMNRYGHKDIAEKIIHHLKETSSNNEEWGMYWIENKAGWNWYNAPVETQALLIEAFTEVNNDIAAADAMKVWLLKNKQNKNWPTTKATAEAVYALLMKGTDWLSVKDNTNFTFGNKKTITDKIAENEKEAGTGYIKLQWKPEEMKQGMGRLTVENKSSVPGFGGFYWQRTYDEADKDYTPAQGILNVTKELYIKAAAGTQLQSVTKDKPLKIGDLVTVRLVITAKEDMEYLHLKDMRASAFEPVDVISERKYNSGTSYYQSTRDVATHFFFDSLNKGVYVIEYDVRVNNAGDFSNGIATIQNMYAPEFSGNSRSVRVRVN